MFRKRFAAWFRRDEAAPGSTPDTVNVGDTPMAAAPVASRPRPPVIGTIGGIANTDRPAASDSQRRRRRGRRRSQESIVGLPIYTEGPAGDELVLVKHDTEHSADFGMDGNESLMDLLPNGVRRAEDDDEIDSENEGDYLTRPSMDSVASPRTGGSYLQGRSRSASDALSTHTSSGFHSIASSDPDRINRAIPIARQSFDPSSSTATLPPSSESTPPTQSSPFARGHRATLSTPQASPPILTGRSRASTLRSIFARSNGSSSSLVPPPAIGLSPYGQGSGQSRSSVRMASGSTLSVSSMNISAPLQHTLVSSSFVMPKEGLTPAQVAFISSRESLGAYGYGPGALPPGFDIPSDNSLTPSTSRLSSDLPSSPLPTSPSPALTTPLTRTHRSSSSASSNPSPLGRTSPSSERLPSTSNTITYPPLNLRTSNLEPSHPSNTHPSSSSSPGGGEMVDIPLSPTPSYHTTNALSRHTSLAYPPPHGQSHEGNEAPDIALVQPTPVSSPVVGNDESQGFGEAFGHLGGVLEGGWRGPTGRGE